MNCTSITRIFAAAALLMVCASLRAEMSAEELAKLAQNPVGNMISLPFQNNTNLNFGPEKGTQNILNIQPVIPIEVDKDWNIITRTIAPIIWMPALSPDIGAKSGFGDIQFSALLSPASPGQLIWAVGPIVQLPTNSNAELGNKNWGWTSVILHQRPYAFRHTTWSPASSMLRHRQRLEISSGTADRGQVAQAYATQVRPK